ncbi:MAG TPA: c-type cytochrome [Steroidobacteraceae bacterium]|nr:c-type cytochrome [Steroidobacteraceae bacterium]
MVREQGPFKHDDPWPRIAWGTMAVVFIVSFLIGFIVLGRFQQNGPALGTWAAFCRAVGLTADRRRATEPQPPQRTPTRIAWTPETLARIASGSEQRGDFVALNCAACHGERGVSPSTLIPTLAGMNPAVIYKQLDDYRSGKRLWGVMSAIAAVLTDQDSADVAAYFAHRPDGLAAVAAEGAPAGGRSLRQHDPGLRLVFAGDPERGIPPCAACHGPGAEKLGAPALRGQHTEYIERQLAAFAQGMRQNDINEQMRVIAHELTPNEMHAVAVYYGAADSHE